MNAEKFLKDSNLSHYVDGDSETKVVYEDDVIYLMEKYHQSKVNNVALDDVSYCRHNWVELSGGWTKQCTICGKEKMIK